jgi:hypothetical protein
MVAGAAVAFILALGVGGADSTERGPRVDGLRVGAGTVAPDTTKPRRKSFALSEAYGTRLRIHKVASYAMLPLFATQYLAGDQLIQKGSAAPQWARSVHPAVATAVAGLFVVNTVTGSLNWWETRAQPGGRTWRTAHAALMLLADAGFTATGLLADEAEDDGDKRRLHRTVAVTSMSVAALSYAMMLSPFRKD